MGVGSKVDDNLKPFGSSKKLNSVWDKYKAKPSVHEFNNVFSNN